MNGWGGVGSVTDKNYTFLGGIFVCSTMYMRYL